MKRTLLLPVFAALAVNASALPIELKSPDGQLCVSVEVRDFGGQTGCAVYRVSWKGRAVVADSRLDMDVDGAPLCENLELLKEARGTRDETWKPVCGERAEVSDRCNTLTLELRGRKAPRRAVNIEFRAYDEGIAWRYIIPKQPGADRVKIGGERSEFRFSSDHTAWAVYSAQGKYAKLPVSGIKPGCERPLVLQLAEDLYAALGEAGLVDFARMKFAPLTDAGPALVSKLDGRVDAALPLTTPWRFVMAAESPGRLVENNFLLLNLNEPCAIPDTSWIRPGKVIREVTLTTTGGKACVDFAVKRNLQYVEFDAGWYGHEYDDASDARAVNLDPKRSKGPLDLAEVIRYAKERNVGVILYVNRRALEKQLDELLPLYHGWGVAGVKYGFVNVGTQQWTRWLHEAVRKAAAHQLMVDIHDEYRPTGYSRTYPNLMTQEGIGGDETTPELEQTLTLIFTRMIAGAADNTICYFDGRVDKMSSHAAQLAKAVCLFSPWQFLYWYDRPPASPPKAGGAGNTQTQTGDEPELEFFDRVPAVWDETRVLHGRIGEFAAIARRNGAEWFIGCLNTGQERELSLKLDFLDPGKRYTASIYSDDPSLDTRTKIRIERKPADRSTVLKAILPARGGQAIRIAP